MIGGALTMAGDFLDPAVKLSDLKSMRCNLQSSLSGIASDLKTLDNGIAPLKDIAKESYEILVDLKYKEGLDLIDSSYVVFLRGLKNYDKSHSRFSAYIVELETKASLSFKEQNIKELLHKVLKTKGKVQAKHLASYIFVVRAKYLQIVTAFYLYDEELERVEEEFESFNNDVKQLQEIHKQLFAEEFQPREPLTWEFVGLPDKVPCVFEDCDEEVPLNKMIEHVNTEHYGKKMKAVSDGLIVILWNHNNMSNEYNYWNVLHCDFSGHTFIPRIRKWNGIYYLYTKILANKDAASKFKVDIEAMNVKNNISLMFPGAKVYPVDMKWQKVIKDEDGVLSFDKYMAKKLFSYDTDKTWLVIKHKTTITQI